MTYCSLGLGFMIIDKSLPIPEIPQPAKPLSFDPFRHYPRTPVSELPTDLPLEYRRQILSLLSFLSTNSASNLVNSHLDSAGTLVFDHPVVNRPWEWIENLGEPSSVDGATTKDEDRDRDEKVRLKTRYLVKNSGSLSLELFGAKMTGDGVVEKTAREYDIQAENIRAFEDGLSTEGILVRDWRESRIDVEQEPSPTSGSGERTIQSVVNASGNGDGDLESGSTSGRTKSEQRSTSMRASPASSVVSQSSAKGSIASLKQSPIAKSRLDQADIGVGTSQSVTTKRKMENADETEIIEGPVQVRTAPPAKRARSSTSKAVGKTAGKTVGKTAGKAKAKKR